MTTLMAIIAGFVLLLMAIMTVVSVTGRSLIWAGLGPIPGDFELVEIGAAVAVFGFFPYCHLHRGHVSVDIFVSRLPHWAFNGLTLTGDLLIAVITWVIAWRLWFGFQEKIAYGESTMILGAPLWYGYGLCFVASVWAGAVAVYVIWRDLRHIAAKTRIS
ncbi:MAG: TRAP transporter small permease [Silicimonas sp.]|nr:TRAP transporter small permease [Silicimonas sp.]